MIKVKRFLISLILMCFMLGSCLPQQRNENGVLSKSSYRLIVPSTGYYYVSVSNLINEFQNSFNVDDINLYYLGEPYPFWIVEKENFLESKILFYAPNPIISSNIKETIFVLAVDGKDQISRLHPEMLPTTNNKEVSLSEGRIIYLVQKQNIYLPDSDDNDHWYWSMIPAEYTFNKTFSTLEENQYFKLRLNLWSPSSAKVNPDHGVQIRINDEFFGEESWDGKGKFTFETDVWLPGDTSEVKLQILPNAVIQFPQKIYLDTIEIEFPQKLNFSDKTIEFLGEKGLVLKRDKTNGFLISFEKGIPSTISVLSEDTLVSLGNNYEGFFSWVPDINFSDSVVIEPIGVPNFDFHPVDYVVIAPPVFHAALSPLIEFRQHQGLQTALFSTMDIYDSLGSGTPSPEVIKKFLNLLREKTGEYPAYLLLVGDYTYDIVNFEYSRRLLPSFFIQSSVAGETVSDFPFADLDNDFRSDLAVGRIPASSPEELSIWIEKILEYEKQNNPGLTQIISVADPSSPTFEQSANIVIQSFEQFPHLLKTYLSDGDELLRLEKGGDFMENSVLFYFGHGSIDRWGKQPILTTQELERNGLPNKPAMIFSFSCLNGYFIHPENRSISETFLFQPDNGTIALFASTSLTYHENQLKFSNQLISELQLKENVRVGDLITSSMREINSDDPNNRDVIKTFILLGDPATSFPVINDL